MKEYYPTMYTGCNPIHRVISWSYVRKLVRAARRGVAINPILIEGQMGSGNLLAGTHRSAANDLMMMLGDPEANMIPVVSTSEIEISEELQDAISNSDYQLIDELWDKK